MLHVYGLGAAHIDAGATRITPAAAKRFGLLLYLAAEPGQRAPRAVLLDLFFPRMATGNARHGLRELLYQVRQSGVQIDGDAHVVEIAAEAVRSDWNDAMEATQLDASVLRAAAGGLLPGYAPVHSEAFANWYERFRARATVGLCDALLREADRAIRSGNFSTGAQAARACLVLDQSNGRAAKALATVLTIGAEDGSARRERVGSI